MAACQVSGKDGVRAPLEGIKALDLSRLLPGPACTLMLADYGADVLKVEDVGLGDYIRWWPPFYGEEKDDDSGTRSASYLALNRSKRSIRVDLKKESGREVLLKLAREHDVLVESFRPGVMDKLGVGFERLKQVNPGLVYCSISGYGQDGPYRDRAGHDMNYLSLTGVLGLTGPAGGPPVQSAVQVADIGGGAQLAAFAILAALIERGRSGQGQRIDISMCDGALTWMALPAARYFCTGVAPKRGEPELSGGWLCYYVYRTQDDRWVSLAALEPKFWKAWCEATGRQDLVAKQFESPQSQAGAEVASEIAKRTLAEWAEFNDKHDCCLEPVLEVDEAMESELLRERGMVIEIEQPSIGKTRQIGPAIGFSRTPARRASAAPGLGQHTVDVLASLGYSEEEIAKLKSEGAVA